MRILHVVPTFWPATRYGGTIASVGALCRSQAEQGHVVRVMTTSVNGISDLEIGDGEERRFGAAIVRYFRCGRFRRICRSPSMGRAIETELKQADVVHLHSVFLWPTWKAARTCRALRVPYIVSPRGMLVPELIAARSQLAKRAWIALIESRTLRQAAAIHVTSERERADLGRVGIGGLPPICVVPNGVDVPDDSGDRPRDPETIVFLGRLSWKKRVDWAIRALVSTPLAVLRIAGPDDEGLRASLEATAQNVGVSDRIEFLGEVDEGRREALLERASLLVLPSISENFGNVVVEALAHGCPVVVTEGVGAAEVVRASRSGWVVPDEFDAFSAAMETAMEHPSEARERGERGRAHVANELGWSGIAVRMVELYRDATRIGSTVHAR